MLSEETKDIIKQGVLSIVNNLTNHEMEQMKAVKQPTSRDELIESELQDAVIALTNQFSEQHYEKDPVEAGQRAIKMFDAISQGGCCTIDKYSEASFNCYDANIDHKFGEIQAVVYSCLNPGLVAAQATIKPAYNAATLYIIRNNILSQWENGVNLAMPLVAKAILGDIPWMNTEKIYYFEGLSAPYNHLTYMSQFIDTPFTFAESGIGYSEANALLQRLLNFYCDNAVGVSKIITDTQLYYKLLNRCRCFVDNLVIAANVYLYAGQVIDSEVPPEILMQYSGICQLPHINMELPMNSDTNKNRYNERQKLDILYRVEVSEENE